MLMFAFVVLFAVLPCACAVRSDLTFETSSNITMIGFDYMIRTVAVGDTFTLNIVVSDVNNLAGWQWWLNYASNIKCTNNIEGSFLKQAISKYGTFAGLSYTSTYAWGYACVLGQTNGASGTGVISTVTFKALTVGTVTLHLTRVELCSAFPNSRGWPMDIPFVQADCIITIA